MLKHTLDFSQLVADGVRRAWDLIQKILEFTPLPIFLGPVSQSTVVCKRGASRFDSYSLTDVSHKRHSYRRAWPISKPFERPASSLAFNRG